MYSHDGCRSLLTSVEWSRFLSATSLRIYFLTIFLTHHSGARRPEKSNVNLVYCYVCWNEVNILLIEKNYVHKRTPKKEEYVYLEKEGLSDKKKNEPQGIGKNKLGSSTWIFGKKLCFRIQIQVFFNKNFKKVKIERNFGSTNAIYLCYTFKCHKKPTVLQKGLKPWNFKLFPFLTMGFF
jgi:hypothetical protein